MPFFPGIVFIVHNTEKYCKSYSNLIEKIPRFLRKVYNFVTLPGIFWQKYTDIFQKNPPSREITRLGGRNQMRATPVLRAASATALATAAATLRSSALGMM